MTDAQKEALETLRNLSLQVMLIAAGVFGIVGGFISSSSKIFQSGWLIVVALLCFAVSWVFGYLVHGTAIGLLIKNQFDPQNWAVQGSSLLQVVAFCVGGFFFVLFVAANL